MAKPIEETPVLVGQDAVKFDENRKANKTKRVDEKTRKKIKANFDKLNAIAEF